MSVNSVRFQSGPRVTSLISGMRRLLDRVLKDKFQNPLTDVMDSEIGRLVLDLASSERIV